MDNLVDTIFLDGHPIVINKYNADTISGLDLISVEFTVKSEEYHQVTTLLYAGEFHVQVPAENKAFRGRIIEYSTSITNLYKSGQVGTFKLVLREVEE
ncbi:DUF3219 family protein [Mesobacillus selenatarsenatis]|uniref:DUF3219 family protein n=1 Tax=Mesobacillus selenatarsenatis TaxID=388741 RepID=UPI0032AEA3A9